MNKMYALFAWEDGGSERVLVAVGSDKAKLEKKYWDELQARFDAEGGDDNDYGYTKEEWAEERFAWNGPQDDIEEVEVV